MAEGNKLKLQGTKVKAEVGLRGRWLMGNVGEKEEFKLQKWYLCKGQCTTDQWEIKSKQASKQTTTIKDSSTPWPLHLNAAHLDLPLSGTYRMFMSSGTEDERYEHCWLLIAAGWSCLSCISCISCQEAACTSTEACWQAQCPSWRGCTGRRIMGVSCMEVPSSTDKEEAAEPMREWVSLHPRGNFQWRSWNKSKEDIC